MDDVTGNGPVVAETAIINTLQLLERICTRNEWITLQTAQLEAVVQGTMTQQAKMTQKQERSSVSLVDTKLVTKTKRVLWKTRWTRTMENVVVQDESVLRSSCHTTVLHPERVDG